MRQDHHFFFYFTSAFMLLSCACAGLAQADTLLPAPTSDEAESISIISQFTETPSESALHLDEPFNETSALCTTEDESSMFNIICHNGIASVSQNDNRRGVDILLQRSTPVNFQGAFRFNVTITSSKAENVDIDQNQYGIVLQDRSGTLYALRLHGQHYALERWGEKNETLFNETYSPYLFPTEQENHIQFYCRDDSCDVYFNEQFSARYPLPLSEGISAAGIFAASGWDQHFGNVQFHALTIEDLSNSHEINQPIHISDDLHADHGNFASTTLSGAFNTFAEDGFHFSSLIPYGYYAAKSEPALANVAVSAVVHMEIDPNSSSSRYAGLICRSSQDGMYMAVIRADGTYSIFRDTPQRPFALLAQKHSDAIRIGAVNNSLRLECKGDQIIFSINGTLVESLTDTRYGLHFGRAGLYTKAGGEPNPDAIIFKDLVIEEMP